MALRLVDFLNRAQKALVTKEKIGKLDFTKIKSLCLLKAIVSENVCLFDKELVAKKI